MTNAKEAEIQNATQLHNYIQVPELTAFYILHNTSNQNNNLATNRIRAETYFGVGLESMQRVKTRNFPFI